MLYNLFLCAMIVLLQSIDLIWHNVPAYYALNYAGIFDGGLIDSTEALKVAT